MKTNNNTYEKVKNAMLAIQRYPWEQGVCMQALYEADDPTYTAMAHDAVLRQTDDGRLAVITHNIAVTDPAANGEPVLRAYEQTGNIMYKKAAEKMLDYLMSIAPRVQKGRYAGLLCHNEISFWEEHSPEQIWVDSCYMAPPFLAAMGEFREAEKQLDGYLDCLFDSETGLLFHIYDAGTDRFIKKKLWATGNGWALLGIARMINLFNSEAKIDKYIQKGRELLKNMLKYQCDSGMFHDILDEPDTFTDGTAAMMTAAFIYRGVYEGWLNREYLPNAELVYKGIHGNIDEFGIIRGVCGSPHFDKQGTSAEAQAAWIMMDCWRKKTNTAG